MSKVSGFSIELMNEIANAASNFGWGAKDLATLFGNESNMKAVLRVLRGSHEIRAIDHFIDCSAHPKLLGSTAFDHNELEIVKHRKMGILNFNLDNVELYISDEQKSEARTNANKLMYEFEKKTNTLNINVLEYLLENQSAIPHEWKEKIIFFWGTILQVKSMGRKYVPHLYYSSQARKWLHDYCPLEVSQIVDDEVGAIMYTKYIPQFSKSK